MNTFTFDITHYSFSIRAMGVKCCTSITLSRKTGGKMVSKRPPVVNKRACVSLDISQKHTTLCRESTSVRECLGRRVPALLRAPTRLITAAVSRRGTLRTSVGVGSDSLAGKKIVYKCRTERASRPCACVRERAARCCPRTRVHSSDTGVDFHRCACARACEGLISRAAPCCSRCTGISSCPDWNHWPRSPSSTGRGGLCLPTYWTAGRSCARAERFARFR